ncbi:MAG: hypothetical protein A2283_23815 [Lentisphaerae bacterium RIFOXYA12_FULL_48_11]|nr:MAG: hypothetical protein A2283_23815 [Lentisphaerae bacterium RIFOXYA12_FULL_48_11]
MNTKYLAIIAIVTAIPCVSVFSRSALEASSTNITAVTIEDESARVLNRRIFEIANNPEILKRLDQRCNYRTDKGYSDVLTSSLLMASRVLPSVFTSTNLNRIITAVCVADSKVFFWFPKDDHVLIGWVPLVSSKDVESYRKEIVLWLVPQVSKRTKLTEAWDRRSTPSVDDSWVVDFLTLALNVKLKNVQKDKVKDKAMRATMCVSNKEHDIGVVSAKSILEIRIPLRSNRDQTLPVAPVAGPDDLNEMPTILPFWPPKECR